MAQHNDLGKWGEEMAATYLEQQGWYIRHRDWRYHHTDIDIVCIDEDDTTLLFVEVKTRATDAYGRPSAAVDAEKRRNIIAAAAAYKRMYRKENRMVRYDIISIIGSPCNTPASPNTLTPQNHPASPNTPTLQSHPRTPNTLAPLSSAGSPDVPASPIIEHIVDAFNLLDVFEDLGRSSPTYF